MATWPTRGQKAPNYWDVQLKTYVDEGTSLIVVNGETVTLDDALPEGRLTSYRVKSTTTFEGGGEESTLAPGAYTFERTETGWLIYTTGEGTLLGTPPDETPPTAVTDLVATAGENTLGGAWSAATDPETTVRYGYRYWLTSEGASGAWTTTLLTEFEATGVAAGDYTVEVYSYSDGGTTNPDTDTASVTAPSAYTEWDRHEFVAANGTLISTLPTVEGRTYAGTSAAAVVHANTAAPNFFTGGGDNSTSKLSLSPPAVEKMQQSIAFDLSNADIGSTCFIQVEQLLTQTGSMGFTLMANTNQSPTSSNIQDRYAYAAGVPGNEPPIVYESGKTANGHPVSGVLTVEIDTVAQRVNIIIDDVLIGHFDTSAFTYSAAPNPPLTTSAGFIIGNRAKVDSHVVEVYA